MYLDCHLYRSLECLSLSKGYRFNHLLIQGILQFDWLKAFSAMSQQGLGDSAMISAGVSGICGGRWCIAGAFIWGHFRRGPTVGCGVFGAGSGFGVGWRGGGVWSLCFGALLLVLAEFLFCRGAVHWAIILWGLDTFLIFPKIICLKSFGNSYMPCL